MEAIAKLDAALFHLVNTGLAWSVFDVVMPFITDKSNFVYVVLAAAAFILIRGGNDKRHALLILVIAVLVGDFLANGLKNVFLRIRPCHALEGVRLLTGCGGSYSFPSGHATNIFAGMVFLSFMYRKLTPLFLAIAVAVAYSRVYVGVHYPLDIFGGAVLGTSTALFFVEADRRWLKALYSHIRNRRGSLEV